GPLDYNGPQNNQGSWKGDVARALFYMALRYEVLELVDGNPDDSTANQLGDLQTLLSWHELDPADDFEMNRNNIIYSWQMNRNPFIDLPDLVDYVYGPFKTLLINYLCLIQMFGKQILKCIQILLMRWCTLKV